MKVIAIIAMLMLPFTALGQITMRLDSIVSPSQWEDEEKYVSVFMYDSLNNIVNKRFTNNYYTHDSIEYKYDDKGKLISKMVREYNNKGILIDCRRYDYEYNKHGILTSRKCLVNQGTRFWKGDKIVETGEQWKVVCHDRCDKRGNIIFCRDYKTADSIYYEYDDLNRMTSAEWHHSGRAWKRIEYTYDRHGNPIRADEFTTIRRNEQLTLEHETSITICYDLRHTAKETAGVNKIIKFFARDEIDYSPSLTNIPTRVSESYANDPEEGTTSYYYYSQVK